LLDQGFRALFLWKLDNVALGPLGLSAIFIG
jgi:hypothetical protein